MNMLAVWIWQARAWTEPQSPLSDLWLSVQAIAVGFVLLGLFIVGCWLFGRNGTRTNSFGPGMTRPRPPQGGGPL